MKQFENIRRVLVTLGPDDVAGWVLRVDGEEVPFRDIELFSKFGLLRFGKCVIGYSQWCFEEEAGGGSILVPFVFDKMDGLLIGVVEQQRPFQSDKKVLSAVRGFVPPGQNPFDSAVEEMHEEFALISGERVFELPGEPANPNSTFFVTIGEEKGVRYYGVQLLPNEVVRRDGKVVLSREVITPNVPDIERVFDCEFIPWRKAAVLSDQFTNTAVARLMAQVT